MRSPATLLSPLAALLLLSSQTLPGTPGSASSPWPRKPGSARLKRKNLAVDFSVPSALRGSVLHLLGDPEGRSGCHLALSCEPLLGALALSEVLKSRPEPGERRALSEVLKSRPEPGERRALSEVLKSRPEPGERRALSEVLKSRPEPGERRALSEVLKSRPEPGERRALSEVLKRRPAPSRVLSGGSPGGSLRRSRQLVLEVGEDTVREGCVARGPGELLDFDLSDLFGWWLRSGQGRLRIRLMPRRTLSLPGKEEGLAAAIRASDPRLIFRLSEKKGLSVPESSAASSPAFSAWNMTWIMRESSSFLGPRGWHGDFDCNFESPCELEYSPPQINNRPWQVVSTEELLQTSLLQGPKKDNSENSAEGHFLFLNVSESESPMVMSPWLRSSSDHCTLEVAVYVQELGKYVVRVFLDNKTSHEILPVSIQQRNGWTLLRGKVGRLEEPFRISLEYVATGNGSVAALDSFTLKNCTKGGSSGSKMVLQGSFGCRNGTAIKLGHVCDFFQDCTEGEDEGDVCRDLPIGFHCSFEEGDCGWTLGSPASNVSHWQRAIPECSQFGFSAGHALVLNTSDPFVAGTAVTTSTIFPAPLKSSACQASLTLSLFSSPKLTEQCLM
ncbi:ALK tyrosine kinase receptor-like [Rhinatrema bivittatum]|uniref:ALK tyrosine kinase receptor-like n=1 Tax=Rhinatrema bivittatum TaxID=194408 RepID=UPI0011291C29|nr:ALK tyrosine kinase receptor-like [Rhinatrema bivittatum]